MPENLIPRICIVGAGSLSTKRIYPNIGAAGGQLVGICDLDAEKAKANARRFGGTVYSDLDRMLDAEKPDGVILCIGPQQHADLALKILPRKIPVYTEKPPAASAAQALQVARAAKQAGVLCTTAFKKRYATCYNRAKQWLAQFNPGDYYSLSIDYASSQYKNDSPRSSFLLDFAIHVIDLTGYLFGDVAEVFAYQKDLSAYAVSVQFACGAVGALNLTCGRSYHLPTEEVELTVKGSNFMTIHNSSTWRIAEGDKAVEWREPPTFISNGDSGNDTGHLAELVDYFAAIAEHRTTRSNIYESYKSMVLYDAIARAAAEKRAIPVVYEAL